MAIWEKFGSRDRLLAESTRSRATLIFMVDGTSDDQVVMNTLLTSPVVPPTFRGLKIVDYQIQQVGPVLWEAMVQYGDADDPSNDDKPELGEIVWSFDTGGGTAHVTTAKKGNTSRYVAAGVAAKEFYGAINATSEDVAGVDIVSPRLKLTAQARLPGATITDAWVQSVARLTGKVNSAAWKGYAAGELLFLGATGSQLVGSGDPQLTFNFEASENAANLVFQDFAGNDITVASKGGHEYLWISFVPVEDTTAKTIVQQPHTVFVQKLYDPGDFTILGLGN